MQTVRLHFAFHCVCVCLIAVGSGCLKKFDRWRVGVEHEESSDENSYISFVHLHTHTYTVGAACYHEISVFLCVREIPG